MDGTYESVLMNNYYFKSSEPDSFVFLEQPKKMIRITKIVNVRAGSVTVFGTRIINNISSIFVEPIDSQKLGMFKAGNCLLYSDEQQFEIHENEFKKMMKFEFDSCVYLINMLH